MQCTFSLDSSAGDLQLDLEEMAPALESAKILYNNLYIGLRLSKTRYELKMTITSDLRGISPCFSLKYELISVNNSSLAAFGLILWPDGTLSRHELLHEAVHLNSIERIILERFRSALPQFASHP